MLYSSVYFPLVLLLFFLWLFLEMVSSTSATITAPLTFPLRTFLEFDCFNLSFARLGNISSAHISAFCLYVHTLDINLLWWLTSVELSHLSFSIMTCHSPDLKNKLKITLISKALIVKIVLYSRYLPAG